MIKKNKPYTDNSLLQFLLENQQRKYSVQELSVFFKFLTRYQIVYRLKKLAQMGQVENHKLSDGIITRHYWRATGKVHSNNNNLSRQSCFTGHPDSMRHS